MSRLIKAKVLWFVNIALLTAVFAFTITPLLGINLAIYSPTHTHIYFGDVDLEHEHHDGHDHSHKVDVKKMSQVELFQFFNESIAFLTTKDVGNLGLFYIALMMLNASLLTFASQLNLLRWSPDEQSVQLLFTPPVSPPPRSLS